MAIVRQQRIRIVGSLLLAAILLVPLVASGHDHATHASARCATCVATQHTPVVAGSIVPVPVTALLVLGVERERATSPGRPAVQQPTGRGPPSLLPSQAA